MEKSKDKIRHEKVWSFLQVLNRPLMKYLFDESFDEIDVDGPFLLIANHSTDLDPLILASCFPRNQLYFVASEHIFRLGVVSKALEWLVAPIPRKKASSGADTVKMCLRRLKAGDSVGLMAEGEATWNGVSTDVFSATGKLVKSSGASLVTVRISGAYLSNPRWGNGFRRGKVEARLVHIYSPEEIEAMSASEVLDAINHDIYENCWERQAENPVKFLGDNRAEHIERAVFLCPSCKGVSTIASEGNYFKCRDCGFHGMVTELGTFEGVNMIPNMYEWDKWQFETLKNMDFKQSNRDGVLFFDSDVLLTQILKGHETKVIGDNFELCQYGDKLTCGMCTFDMSKITNMSMVQAKRLLLSYEGSYFEIKANNITSLRKYLGYWQNKTWEVE
ncbi:MAG: 1-acyl-sn-glycerol-3-phosphate acyltransferase [Oscillospiraceae bacterium]|nr:1-acyl-sn-glycerol-3-phosphate acyltransferase [Candidatus Limimonas egerieequi]